MSPRLAVTGSTGTVGGLVARALAERGVPVRLVGRDPTRLPDLPGSERAPAAEYRDTEGMRRALDGVETVFLVSGRESADRVAEHRSAIEAAAAAGVQRVVYLSFLGAAADCTFTFGRDHWHTEQAVRATGLRHTFLRDSFYSDFLPFLAGDDGLIRGPAGDGRVSAVAQADVADVATAVLLSAADGGSSPHDGQTYDVTGPEAVSLPEVARTITEETGREVQFVDETVEEAYASRAPYGAPPFEVDGWVTTYLAIARGEVAAVSDVVPRLTGHPARTVAGVVRGRARTA